MPHRPLDYESRSAPSSKVKIGPLWLGGAVLFVYPFCLLANIMSFAAAPAQGTAVEPLVGITSKAFLWSSTLYPVVYVVAVAISLFLSSNDRPRGARGVGFVPLVYLVGVALCFIAWGVAE